MKVCNISFEASKEKPRRSVLRSLSWKRANKRTKMDESEQEHGFDSADGGENGERRFVAGSAHGMSDEDADDTIFDSTTESTSKKRKKVGVWKAVKRFFSRKSSKSRKSFTFGDSLSPHGQPRRSISDPNLAHTSGEKPDLAPLKQVNEATMETDAAPKKAMSVS